MEPIDNIAFVNSNFYSKAQNSYLYGGNIIKKARSDNSENSGCKHYEDLRIEIVLFT